MRTLATAITISLLGLGLSVASAAPLKQQRIVAETVDLSGKSPANVQLQIWADRVPALLAQRQSLQKSVPTLPLVAEFFTTSFQSGSTRIVVSAVNDQCSSVETQPDDLFCPARIAELRDGAVKVLKEIPDLDIHLVRGEAGYDATSNRSASDMTLAAFDPSTQTISVMTVEGGKAQPGANTYKLH